MLLGACGDFSAIFRGGRPEHRNSKKDEGRKLAGRKTRGGKAKVVKGYFIWPVEGEVSSGFGERDGRPHDGIDIRAPKGTPVHASAGGEVVYSGKMSGYGNLILIRHRDNYFTAYAHNEDNLAKEGKRVEQGDLVARVGDTGNASGTHLHFEVRQGSTPVNPIPFLPAQNDAFAMDR